MAVRAKRASPGEFPIPNHTFERCGGSTETMLEELTLTYNCYKACREAWLLAPG